MFDINISALINAFPNSSDMQICENTKEYLKITHKDASGDVWDESSNLELCNSADFGIELLQIVIDGCHQGQGYGKKVLTELIKQCQNKRISLYSSITYYDGIMLVRSVVNQHGLHEFYREEPTLNTDDEEDGQWYFRFIF